MSKILSIANQKGGVGKTSTVYALGETLNRDYKLKVLMIDMDAQSSLTRLTGVKPQLSMVDVLAGEATIGSAVIELEPGLWIAPSSPELSQIELGLASHKNRLRVLEKALAKTHKAVDIIILDLPPSLGLLTVNGLVASQAVVIPSRATMLDIAGLSLFLETAEKARALNPALEVLGILLTFFDTRIKSMERIIKELRELNISVYNSRIGQSIRVAESLGGSVISSYPTNKRAVEYIEFTKEIYNQWIK